MNTPIPSCAAPHAQRGAILVVSLLLLLVMTVLALSMSQTSRLQERMAGNSREYELAFQAAEAALRIAESDLTTKEVDLCSTPSPKAGECNAVERGALADVNLRDADATWWKDNSKDYGSTSKDMANLYADPSFVAENLGKESFGGLDIGRGAPEERQYYKITANGYGRSSTTRAVAESVVAALPQ